MTELTYEERVRLRRQFIAAYDHSQETFDSSVRTLAAAGVAVTVTLASLGDELNWPGVVAVVLFLVSLGCNVASYETAQRDMRERVDAIDRNAPAAEVWGNHWTVRTSRLNLAAAIPLIAGGLFLVGFAAAST